VLVLGGSFLVNALQNPGAAQNPAIQPSPTALAQAATDTPAAGAQVLASNPVTQAPPVGSSQIYVEYILDASGSMLETTQGKTRLAIAQDVLSSRVAALPPDIRVGLRVYGHRVPFQQEEESCQDIELIVPIQEGGAEKIVAWLPTMQALGMTPMSESIRQAAEDFTFEEGRQNSIVLISDGIETCGDDPANVVRYLQELGIDFTIHVIGLLVDPQARDQLRGIAEVSGGVYHDANSEQDLADALDAVTFDVVEEALIAMSQPAEPTPTLPEPTPADVPATIVDVTSEGSAQASTIYDATFPASLSVDGDLSTSWFSAGPSSGGTTTYQWSGVQDDLFTTVSIISNSQHQRQDFRTGFGFGQVIVQILDDAGQVVWEQTVALPGPPDPDVVVQPDVVGRSILLTFSGHEDATCGGFGELLVEVSR
jgi:Mg-chelatase subunit ChlD